MCGIVGYWDKTAGLGSGTGRVVLTLLEALACRGPDSAGVALFGPEPQPGAEGIWWVRTAPGDSGALERVAVAGRVVPTALEPGRRSNASSLRFGFRPESGVTAEQVERLVGDGRGGAEVLCLGRRLDLVKQVGSPEALETAYAVSTWSGPLAIGHTRLSTESRIDLSHSQPFWVHGVPDLATVHNGHITNYHQLRRRYEQEGTRFFTDNDSEVIGVYLRSRLERGRSLREAMTDSLADLDGSYNYLVAGPEGLGIVRDRYGFKPLVLVETDQFVAVATEEIALRRALRFDDRVIEPPPGSVLLYGEKAGAQSKVATAPIAVEDRPCDHSVVPDSRMGSCPSQT
jgi:glutamine phosphoribosylpyrophosphate amidotransferase